MVEVSILVPASKGEFNTFIASCDSKLAISLADGSTDSSDFMKVIMGKMEIL